MSARRMLLVILTTCLILQLPASANSLAATGSYSSRLGPEFRISEPTPIAQPDRYDPAVAYNSSHHEYLAVWTNAWAYSPAEIYAQRVSASGQLIGGFLIASGLGDGKQRGEPAVAYNAANDEYLVVYVYIAVDETDYDIRGRRIAWDGSWMGPEFEIFSWANRGFFWPRVVWNPYRNQYLLVSSVQDTVSKLANDVAGRRVMADGSMPYPMHNISAQSQTLQPQAGDVTYNFAADEYLVVWRQNYSGDDWDIWGARVRGDNDAVVDLPGPFFIDRAGVDQDHPAVTTNGQDRYLVVWDQKASLPASDWDIYGRELDITGSQTTPDPFVIANTSDEETFPDVEINGANNQRMVVWRRTIGIEYAIWGFAWLSGVMTLWFPFEIAPASRVGAPLEERPALAAGASGFLSAYQKRDATSFISFIYGRLYWEYNLYLPHISKN